MIRSGYPIFSVKAGGVAVSQVRDLVGVIHREKAQIGVFLSLNPNGILLADGDIRWR